jgi:hypothetical protein
MIQINFNPPMITEIKQNQGQVLNQSAQLTLAYQLPKDLSSRKNSAINFIAQIRKVLGDIGDSLEEHFRYKAK